MAQLFQINAAENLQLNFDVYVLPATYQFQGAYNNATAYNLNDVVVPTGATGIARKSSLGVIRTSPSTSIAAYICILANTGHTPPNPTYWTPLSTIALTNLAFAMLELINASDVSTVQLPFTWVGAPITQPPILTSGLLTQGSTYKIITYNALDDFRNIGGTNASGTIFTATGTTPTAWTFGSSLQQILIAFGNQYIIESFVSGDDFTNLGATNATGNIFTSTGIAPNVWSHGSILQQVSFPTTVKVSTGLVQFELLASVSALRPTGSYGLRLSLAQVNSIYISSDAESDVLGFASDIITITDL